jgi:hypothetical protein
MSATRDQVVYRATVDIGAAGAASFGASSGVAKGGKDDPGITATLNGTGTYDLTYPKGKNVWIHATLKSAALTVVGVVVTAVSATAGTATIKTLAGTNAAVATNPANGDAIMLEIAVER